MIKNIKSIISILILFCSVSLATVHEVQIVGNTFSPQNITIEAGDTVRWINNGGFHNVEANGGLFKCSDSCEVSPGDGNGSASNTWTSVEVTFNNIGLFDYFCEIHIGAGMIGSVTVENPTSVTVHEIHSSNFVFTPNDLTIAAGDVVNFINDSGLHNVRADDDSFECSEGCLGVGTNLSSEVSSQNWSVFVKFDNAVPGSDNPYYCEQHGGIGGQGMSGVIRILNSDIIFSNSFE